MIVLIAKAIHFFAIPVLLFASWRKNALLARVLVSERSIHHAIRYNFVSMMAAIVLVASGLVLLLAPGQPTALYLAHPLFWIKVALFIAASAMVLSLRPWMKRGLDGHRHTDIPVPERVRAIQRFDLFGVLLLIALGYVMTNYN